MAARTATPTAPGLGEAVGSLCLCSPKKPLISELPFLRVLIIYIVDVYYQDGIADLMSDTGIAKIFMHGRSQAVRLPLAFRLPGDRVRVRRTERGILLEPMAADIDTWFAELDRFADVPFMEDGRRQPPMPASFDLFG